MDEHFDVLIVGAGIAGISSAVQLQRTLPGKSFQILEARNAVGGTWDLFRYPGVRSDSDMFTLGFEFKPWEHPQAIADGSMIRDYVQAAAAEQHIDERIRFGSRVTAAEFDSRRSVWVVTVQSADGETTLTAGFIHFCSGYYSYADPYTPRFAGIDKYAGKVVHPQLWPQDLDYSGKRVVVIGSGATAISIVPALAEQAGHVTMLQRSPSYIVSLPAQDAIANVLRRFLPCHFVYRFARAQRLAFTYSSYQFLLHAPRLSRWMIKAAQKLQLPKGFDFDTHFTPRYEPWDERVCIVRNGDLFKAISAGNASIATDQIDHFTETGIRLVSGAELDADIVVTATGLALELFGGAELSVDGVAVDPGQSVSYKGAMLSGVPNLALTFGYVNASWTLKADLISTFVTRLLSYMDANRYAEAMPLAPPPHEPRQSFLDLQSGYVRRAEGTLPQRGMRDPWLVHQSYTVDRKLLTQGPVADEGLRFSQAQSRSAHAATAAAHR